MATVLVLRPHAERAAIASPCFRGSTHGLHAMLLEVVDVERAAACACRASFRARSPAVVVLADVAAVGHLHDLHVLGRAIIGATP